ncbi:5-(carboxyamino)imidazole ribonucleotide synthase [Sphingopyxis alaskensis]|uniref:N5-carboxyaminoimidazole ribonucleotide synthase n=1 Tax=Sphingopyxis alaskensis (strain DSM 13593 / LMG 18877 / RB2256) TaxID=317655 RepID=Q1GQK2_SPHAL|nr:5-(carboxyamino)imidazole ribonucleotide synthase [Sphingopyxis alaskensis]ABF54070.1 phosphoribosylaminoimidazole carboxylase [Sphingopyxis alaskensis RB2256]MCM3418854.1 5-(carboxyamino)imidazole ribonucleotide synthase [Sphingopyxis alaskensis]
MLSPGSTIGILGGGQLGRMLGQAAAQLGYRVHIYAPDRESVAADVAAHHTRAAWDDDPRLAAFAAACDVVTFEFENVPVDTVRFLSGHVAVRPGAAALEIAQDRLAEKRFVVGLGGRPAPFAAVPDRPALDTALGEVGAPAILKTVRMGYDGKGQARLATAADADAAWDAIDRHAAVLEGFVTFTHEFSAILVRGIDGEVRFWDSPVNVHANGILASSSLPPPREVLGQQEEARGLMARIAAELDYVGVLTGEFFATADGPVFNEMAPRVHNSGHWTIEGAVTSQFENHIRAVAGLPLGSTATTALPVTMRNLIGAEIATVPALLADDAAHVHHYGKAAVRDGRKLGHVTWVGFGVGNTPA